MLRPAHGEDVVVDHAVFAVPLDDKALLAAFGVPGERPVAEPEPLHVTGLPDEIHDAGGVHRPEAVVSGEHTDRSADLYRRLRREEPDPPEIELPPSA